MWMLLLSHEYLSSLALDVTRQPELHYKDGL